MRETQDSKLQPIGDSDPTTDADGIRDGATPHHSDHETSPRSELCDSLRDMFCWRPRAQAGPVNKYKLLCKYVNLVCLMVFPVVWICVTLGFLIGISA